MTVGGLWGYQNHSWIHGLIKARLPLRKRLLIPLSMHRGTTNLLLDEKKNALFGEYYSGRDRQKFGSLYLEKL
jgi:hypothetical protein